MHCMSCGIEAAADETSCVHCGAPAPLRCKGCGAANPRDAAHCGGCGGDLTSRSGPGSKGGSGGAPLPSMGELKQVTVLFADLGGSFQAIQGADPEEAEALLDCVVSVMTQAVQRFDGTVNQVLGDGIMAVFGAPIAHEDHAVRAACAALEMQAAVKKLVSPSWAARRIAPQIRVGLHSGEVVVRSVRHALTVEYRAIGSTTHLAARMEQMAERGAILLTEHVMRLGRGMLRARSIGPVGVRGLDEPVHVFELLGVATRTRFQATIERGLSPFVGRSAELTELIHALRRAREGASTAFLVTGEPGIGKSRLCHELLRSPEARACRVLEASALSYASTTTHAMLTTLLKALLEVHDDEGPADVEANVQAKLAGLGHADALTLTVVLELLGISREDGPWRGLEPVQRMRAIEQTVRDLLTAWCNQGPAILVLEDLHWADPESAAFVWGLFRSPPGHQTLLLGTSRSSPAAALPEEVVADRCALAPLPPRETDALVTALVGKSPSLTPLRRRLVPRTAGNPFFVEESVRAYVEMGMLEGHPGDYVLRRGVEEVAVPATIESLVAARLDQVDPGALEVLDAAAVLGDESSIDVLRAIAGLSSEEFDVRFGLLTSSDLLYQTGAFETPLFRFRHAVIRDVAYGRILRSRRRSLHARAVETLEALYPARLAEHVERLAEHAHRAELWMRAARYHQLACVRAANRWANTQAIGHLDRGLAILARAEPSPEREIVAIELRLVALAALLPAGDHERIISLLREAETHAQALGHKAYLAKIYSQLGTALWLRGRHEEAMQVAKVAHARALELAHFPLATATRFSLAIVHHARGELSEARAILRQLISELAGSFAQRRLGWAGYPAVLARSFVISCDALLGAFVEADEMYAEGRTMAEVVNHPYSWTMLLEEYGFSQLVRGEARSARALLERAMRICVDNEVVVMRAPIAARLGAALVDSGAVEEGRALLEDALEREFHRTAGHYAESYLLIALSEAQARCAEPGVALETAREAEKVTRLAGERGNRVCALTQLGAALAGADDRAGALAAYAEALRDARSFGMTAFEALALQGQAAVLADEGHSERAVRDLDSAAELWRQAGAPARLEQVIARREAIMARSDKRAPGHREERSTPPLEP